MILSLRLLVCAAVLIALPVLAGNSIPLAWNPSVGSNVAGYKIYYGGASHAYTNSVYVGNVTNTTITGLSPNTTYYFAATTYNKLGIESGFSNEAMLGVLPPTAPAMTQVSQVNGQFAFNVSGVTNQCVVQASTNMVDWVSIQTNTAPFTFVDPNAGQFQHRFYRTYYLQ
jgi:fibronectin type III domain protein